MSDLGVDESSAPVQPPRSSWSARIVTLVVAVAACALIYVLVTSDSGDDVVRTSPLLDELVPPLSGTTIEGDVFDIDEQRGSWVVVNFFASWCVPCQEEHPELVAFSADHEEAGDVVVVGVPFDNREDDVRRFFDENGGDWPVLIEGQQRAAVNFGVTGVPESYLVAPDGTVVARFFQVDQELLDATIAAVGGGST